MGFGGLLWNSESGLGFWEETFDGHPDSKPDGPTSVGMDVFFPGILLQDSATPSFTTCSLLVFAVDRIVRIFIYAQYSPITFYQLNILVY